MKTIELILTYVIPTLILGIPGFIALYRITKKDKAEIGQSDGNASASFAIAAKTYADMNTELNKRVNELEGRLAAVENPKNYRITLEFSTSIPPRMDNVKIEECV